MFEVHMINVTLPNGENRMVSNVSYLRDSNNAITALSVPLAAADMNDTWIGGTFIVASTVYTIVDVERGTREYHVRLENG